MEGTAGRPAPRVAFWLSAVVPGLGQVYAGAPLRGLSFFALTAVGAFVVVDGLEWGYVRPHPEGLVYLCLGVALLGGSWPASAFHARRHAASLPEWPFTYRYLPQLLDRPAVQRALGLAAVELAMALFFVLLTAFYLVSAAVPGWLREVPRYWFLYEAGVALYLAVVHGALATLDVVPGRRSTVRGARPRVAGFFLASFVVAAFLHVARGVPIDALVAGFLVALPSCWHSLRERKGGLAAVHMERFARSVLLGFASLVLLALAVNAWGLVSSRPEYEMRLRRDGDFFTAVTGALYYSLSAAWEAWRSRQPPPPAGQPED